MNPFKEETFPYYIKYVLYNEYNINYLIKTFGGSIMKQFLSSTYIRINLKEESWYPTFDFEWLYRNQPPIISIDELNKYLRIIKINKLCTILKN